MHMISQAIESIREILGRLTPAERAALADEVDRMTWRDRVQVVLDSIAENVRRDGAPTDEEIDATVREVRAEKSLYERYWTRRRP